MALGQGDTVGMWRSSSVCPAWHLRWGCWAISAGATGNENWTTAAGCYECQFAQEAEECEERQPSDSLEKTQDFKNIVHPAGGLTSGHSSGVQRQTNKCHHLRWYKATLLHIYLEPQLGHMGQEVYSLFCHPHRGWCANQPVIQVREYLHVLCLQRHKCIYHTAGEHPWGEKEAKL